jgi:hypothetical protein
VEHYGLPEARRGADVPDDEIDDIEEIEVVTTALGDDGAVVVDDLKAVVDGDGNVLATDETIAVETPDGTVVVDEVLAVADDDGDLVSVEEDAVVIEAVDDEDDGES